MTTRLALGMMSGTSLDGIDAALLQTNGEDVAVPMGSLSVPYSDDERRLLLMALQTAQAWEPGHPMPEMLAEAERHLTFAHARAVQSLLQQEGLSAEHVDVIGFHGQTVLHRPESGRTEQIGLGDILADLVGIDVVNDFRTADVSAGGEGAPLAPIYHRALSRQITTVAPLAVINIGGVSNVTFLGEAEADIIAFDTGPGNALIDDWVSAHTGARMDEGGRIALSGQVNSTALQKLMDNSFFESTAPKSLDRLDFHMRAKEATDTLSLEDGAATLTEFTAAAISACLPHLPEVPKLWVIVGGGRHNPTLLKALRNHLPGEVKIAEEVAWRGDEVEAEAFAYMAVRSLEGLPISFPGTTGVPHPLTGGAHHKTRRGAI